MRSPTQEKLRGVQSSTCTPVPCVVDLREIPRQESSQLADSSVHTAGCC